MFFLPDRLWQAKAKNKSVNMRWLSYWFASDKTRFLLSELATGTSASMKNITKQDVMNLKIDIPPLPEQTKIAEILSTWDNAIATTEQLLANSEQQKKALMQQLLTGKKRVGGVSKEWKKYSLDQLGYTYTGLSGKSKSDFGKGKQYIPYMNIFKNHKIDINFLELVNIQEDENQNSVKYGDIFFTTSSETPDEVGMTSVLLDNLDNVYLNSFCFGYRLNDFTLLLPEFAQFLFRSEAVRREISMLGQGATRYNLSKTQLMKLEIPLPTLTEQQKIAEILTTADQEIAILTQKLDCLKQEKKALMQGLLSGKVRVKK
ncbi:restriction endonuclease subunit S [Actinobacillus vicugnae]|uniref:restriction endonuclease subunit S n=1 Tax=Actinobacillus vicugnae TaxID=2573093 RepID=UPI00142EB643|nr:restriction endonuclease subunit S [Actinobacillus vicugnae]